MIAEDQLRKQRTKLIGISIALWLYEGLGLSFEKISILGNDINVTYPLALQFGLWGAGFYWLLRFYQVYHHLVKKSDHTASATYNFWRDFDNKIDPLIHSIATPLVRKYPKEYLNNDAIYVFKAHKKRFNSLMLERKIDEKHNNFSDTLKPSLSIENSRKKFKPWKRTYKFTTRVLYSPDEHFAIDFFGPLNKIVAGDKYVGEYPYTIDFLPWMRIWTSCIYRFIFVDYRFSQYWWPFIAFYIAIVIRILKWMGIWSPFMIR